MKQEKRALTSHIEMILSFGIFFFFVLFLLLYIKPNQETPLQDSVILSLKDSFERNTSVSLIQIFLKVNVPDDCFSVSLPGYNGSSIVTGTGGSPVDSFYSGTTLSALSGSGTYYVFISPEFSAGTASCADVAQFSFGSITERTLISNKSLQDFKDAYVSDYKSLKRNLKIPDTSDFTINSSDGEFYVGRVIPKTAEPISRDYSEDVLYSDGSIRTKDFIFQVW